MWTTAILSQWQRTRWPCQYQLQVATATMIGMSSLTVMANSMDEDDQRSWNHSESCQAPQPQEPDASEAYFTVAVDGGQKDTPFPIVANVCHQARSDQNPLLRRIWWC